MLSENGAKDQADQAAIKAAKKLLVAKLCGKVIVEPGCGLGKSGIEIAERFSAEGYIGVDRRKLDCWSSQIRQDGSFNVEFKDMDMLSFIARLPDSSVNFLFNGIDFMVLNEERYWERLGREVWRKTEKGGIVFGICSVTRYFKQFNVITPHAPWHRTSFGSPHSLSDDRHFFILEKKD